MRRSRTIKTVFRVTAILLCFAFLMLYHNTAGQVYAETKTIKLKSGDKQQVSDTFGPSLKKEPGFRSVVWAKTWSIGKTGVVSLSKLGKKTLADDWCYNTITALAPGTTWVHCRTDVNYIYSSHGQSVPGEYHTVTSWKVTVTETYEIIFDFNDGVTQKLTRYVEGGSALGTLPKLERAGYRALGWYDKNNQRIYSTTICNAHATYTAHWEQIDIPKVTLGITKVHLDSLQLAAGKIQQADGYQVKYSESRSMTDAATVSSATGDFHITGLKKSTAYYFRVRAYGKDSLGNTVYGKWSGRYKKVMPDAIINAKSVKLLKGQTLAMKLNGADAATVWNAAGAAVSVTKDGTVTALEAGSATISTVYKKKRYKCIVTVEAPSMPQSATLIKGQTCSARLAPTTFDVTYTSDNTRVATVDADGLVTAQSTGVAVITATANGKAFTSTIAVEEPVIPTDNLNSILGYGRQIAVSGTTLPVTWTSADTGIASVSADGTVMGIGVGTTYVTASINGWTKQIKVTVQNPQLSATYKYMWKKGICIAYTKDYKDIMEPGTDSLSVQNTTFPVTWSSSDASIVSVDDSGNITALSAGIADIIATVEGVPLTCRVEVEYPIVQKLLPHDVLVVGEQKNLYLSNTAYADEAVWSLSDTNAASLENGVLTGLAEGSTVLSVTIKGHTFSAYIPVNERYGSIKNPYNRGGSMQLYDTSGKYLGKYEISVAHATSSTDKTSIAISAQSRMPDDNGKYHTLAEIMSSCNVKVYEYDFKNKQIIRALGTLQSLDSDGETPFTEEFQTVTASYELNQNTYKKYIVIEFQGKDDTCALFYKVVLQ